MQEEIERKRADKRPRPPARCHWGEELQAMLGTSHWRHVDGLQAVDAAVVWKAAVAARQLNNRSKGRSE